MNSRGLELGDMENVSDDEVRDFASFYNSVLGHRHIGLDLWLDTRPDVLKRYRQYSDTATPRTFEDDHRITGAGFTTFYARSASAAEVGLMRDWYARTLGEVPPYVELLLELRPELLKAYRDRYENLLRELPTEFIPSSLLHYDVIRGFGEGIRENVLLLRALGVSRDLVVSIAGSASLNGGMAGFSILANAAGDVLRDWGAR
jgi:hypothetical protein